MKKILLVLSIAFCGQSFAQTYSGGDGSFIFPYQIANLADLQYLSEHSSDWVYEFQLTADIDASATSGWNVGDHDNDGGTTPTVAMGFSPIGQTGNEFKGAINGNGYSISNLYINRPGYDNIGLFGVVMNMDNMIRNIKLPGANITGGANTGALVGSTITNFSDYMYIMVCSSSGSVTGSSKVGGLIGLAQANTTIMSSSSAATVNGGNQIGGFIGRAFGCQIQYSSASGNVSGSETGGFAGTLTNSASASYCYATSNVTGTTSAAGFVNSLSTGGTIVQLSYASGAVSSSSGIAAGFVSNLLYGTTRNCYSNCSLNGATHTTGFAHTALNCTIENCYAYNTHTTSGVKNGFISDDLDLAITITNSYWDTDVSGTMTSDGGTGHTTGNLQLRSTFSGWDFLGESSNGTFDYWYMSSCNGGTYPKLVELQTVFTGSGNSSSPYLIENKTDLKKLADNQCLAYKYVKQTADISLSAADFQSGGLFENAGKGFLSISINGTYDGDYHVVDGIYHNESDPFESHSGMFELINGTVQNLGVTNVELAGGGGQMTGAFASNISGTVSNCFVTGTVAGNSEAGGFAGRIVSGANISNCYADVDVNAATVGGFAGAILGTSGTIQNCFAVGAVSGGSSQIGGFSGSFSGLTVSNCFWNTETTGQASSSTGTGASTTQMLDQGTFTDASWDFEIETTNGSDDFWKMGQCNNGGFPVFTWQTITAYPTVSSSTPASRCGDGAITIGATPAGAATIKWYTASSGGSAIVDDADYDLSGNDLTVNNLTASTPYYAEAELSGCVSTNRTEVTATRSALPTVSSTTPAARCGSGSITISASPSAGSIKWYTVSSGGTAITNGGGYTLTGNDLTISSLGTTTAYYAEADNGACVSTVRSEVFATINTCYSGGSGTLGDPYQIATKADLKRLSETSGDWASHFIQTADITFAPSDFQSGGDFNNSDNGFIPIGSLAVPFTGRYNGDNYSISNIEIARSTSDYVGFFGYGNTGLNIRNIKLVNITADGRDGVGGLLGYQATNGDITNCHVSGTITGRNNYCGGLIGYANGLIVSNSSANTNIIGYNRIGGFIGRSQSTTITKSYAKGSITLLDPNFGGSFVGGFIGGNSGGTYTDCFTTVSIEAYSDIGGFIGIISNGFFTNCYAANTIAGDSYMGGFASDMFGATITACFWNTDLYASNPVMTGVSGKTTAEMKTQSTFTGASWNFSTIWQMDLGCPNDGYPIFQWETTQAKPTVDDPADVRACSSYELPALTNGTYYTGTGGSGSTLNASDVLNSTQTVYVYAGNASCSAENSFLVTVFDCIELDVASCGSTLTNLSDAIYAETVPGATAYRFKVVHSGTSYEAGTSYASNFLRLSWFTSAPAKYGTTYQVYTSAQVGGLWMPFGNACNVTTPATRLTPASSDITIGTLNDALYSYEVAGATNYRYEIRKQSDNSLVSVSTRAAGDNLFRLGWVTGIEYNTTYKIRVSAYVSGAWQTYGPSANVTTPLASKLSAGSCGITLSTLSQALYCDVLAGATNYRYEIRKQSDNSLVSVSTRNASDNLFRLSWVTGVQLNTTYSIKVCAYMSGSWIAYGPACTVTTPTAMILDENPGQEAENREQPVQQITVVPNPSNGQFIIHADQAGRFEMLNELGQLIQVIEIDQSGSAEVNHPTAGVYFIRESRSGLMQKVLIQ